MQYTSLFGCGYTVSMAGPLIPYLRSELGFSLAESGYFIASIGVGSLLSIVVLLAIIHRVSRKALIGLGNASLVISLVLSVFSSSFVLLVLLGLLRGVGNGFTQLGVQTVESEKRGVERGKSMGRLHMSFSVGAISAPIVAGFIGLVPGAWRMIFLLGAVPLTLGSLALRVIPPSGMPIPPRKPGSRRGVLRSPIVYVMAFIAFLFVSLESMLYGWVPSYWSELVSNGLEPATLAIVLACALALGRFGSSLFADRVGVGRFLIAVSVVVTATTLLWTALPIPVVVVAAVAVIGFTAAGIFPMNMAIAAHRFPEAAGFLTNFILVFASLGAMVLPAAFGEIAETHGTQLLAPTLAALAAMLLIAAVVVGKTALRIEPDQV